MKIKLVVLCWFLTGCASSTYFVEVAPRHTSVAENFFQSSTMSMFDGSDWVDFHNYKVWDAGLTGVGGQISLVEITDDWLFARIGYFYNRLKSDSFSFSIANSAPIILPVEVDSQGIDFSIGVRIWHFTPHVFSSYTKMKFKNIPELNMLLPEDSSLIRDHIPLLGGGLAIDIPLSDSFSLFLNSQFSKGQQTYTLGLLMGGWTLQRGASPKSSSRKPSSSSKRSKSFW